ncbi:MAG TPA: helix-turn-helix domain-containing protein [Myxococcota bacterium]
MRALPRRAKPTTRRRSPPAPAPDRILSAALAAFAERGFDGATTREIAADAGVPQGLVTYHYASKQALWEAAVDWVFGELAADFRDADEALRDVDPAARLRATLKRFVRFSARRPELHRFVTHEGSHDGPRLRWLVDRHIRPLFEGSTARIREAAPSVDAALLHYVMLGAAAHVFAVAPEFARVTGRDALAAETIEAHANAVVDWLVAGALAQGSARPRAKRTRRTA